MAPQTGGHQQRPCLCIRTTASSVLVLRKQFLVCQQIGVLDAIVFGTKVFLRAIGTTQFCVKTTLTTQHFPLFMTEFVEHKKTTHTRHAKTKEERNGSGTTTGTADLLKRWNFPLLA